MLEVIVDNFWKITGATLGFCFSAWLAWRHFLKKRRVDAADKFRQIVLSELRGLYPIATNWPEHSHDITYVLKEVFPSLSAAVTEFSSHAKDKKAFLSAWDYYRLGDSKTATGEQDYFQYTGAYFDDQDPPDPKEIFRTNVSRLIEYCEKI